MNAPRTETARTWKYQTLKLALLSLVLLAWPARPCLGQSATQKEYEIKAGALFHIIEYVDWPAGALPNEPATIQIGIIGQVPFFEAFEVLNGKSIQGRKLIVKHVSTPAEADACQVLFIGASEKLRLPEIVAQVKDRPVLTVGESEGFAERGGMVNLVAGPNRIIMEINREVGLKSHLSFSSQLLKLAKVFPR
jgi:hypothetical protein